MKKNITVFKIPGPALEDPEMSEYIDGLMKETLTKQRAMIKAKASELWRSMDNNLLTVIILSTSLQAASNRNSISQSSPDPLPRVDTMR